MNNAVYYPFTPQTPETPEESQISQKRAAAAAASCSGRAGARARTREEASAAEGEALAKLARYYCATFGRRNCAPAILRTIRDALMAGMQPKTVAMAMDAAAEAETPSWAYAAAVIRGCLADGALSPDDFRARSARHRSRRSASGGSSVVPNALNYSQRSYAEGELDHIFGVLDAYLGEN